MLNILNDYHQFSFVQHKDNREKTADEKTGKTEKSKW
jgi:hypothetical protein